MYITATTSDDKGLITISGEFRFDSHRKFREAFGEVKSCKTLTIDLSDCSYMDSAALGLLLIARESFPNSRVRLIGAKDKVLAVLNIASFGKLFDIS